MQRQSANEIKSRRGAVLIVVLAAIVVSGVALTTLARTSQEQTRRARAAADDLQRRWGERSCQSVLLQSAASLFEQQDESIRLGGGSASNVIRTQFRLGDQAFDIVIADEDAKVNLNVLYHYGERPLVERVANRLVGPEARRLLDLQPRVASSKRREQQTAGGRSDEDEEDTADETALPPAFATWADVLSVARLRAVTGDDRMLASLTRDVTLWNNERLNARRASDDAIIAVSQAVVPEGLARRILDRIRDNPKAEVAMVVRNVVKNEKDRQQLVTILGQGSTSFSVWIESTSLRFRRQKFAVVRADSEGASRSFEFSL